MQVDHLDFAISGRVARSLLQIKRYCGRVQMIINGRDATSPRVASEIHPSFDLPFSSLDWAAPDVAWLVASCSA